MAYQIEQQFSLFDPEPVEAPDPFIGAFRQSEIDRCLCRGSSFCGGKLRIYRQYEKGLTAAKAIDFLKKEYGTGGCFPAYCCQDRSKEVTMDWGCQGIKFRRLPGFSNELLLSWVQVEQRIRDLIEAGAYMQEEDRQGPCYSCIFEQDGWCKHIRSGWQENWYCSRGSFRLPKDLTCSHCGRKIRLEDIQQADMGADSYTCKKCGYVTIFNNKGNRPTPMELWEAGKLAGGSKEKS